MQLSQVAAQLYTLRDHTKTPDDIARTLEKVRAIGYEAVQCSALGPIEDDRLRQLAEDNGLTICAMHHGLPALIEQPEKIIAQLQATNCPHTALGSPGGVDLSQRGSVLEFAHRFDESAKKFADAGLGLSFHNHHSEFQRISDAQGETTPMDLLFDNTQHVGFELDTYWVQYGGANSESWARKVAGRAPLIHLKDYGLRKSDQGGGLVPVYVEVGAGNLEFPAIIKAAEEGGTQWFIVEQDTTPGDPFDSLQQSFNYIKNNLVS